MGPTPGTYMSSFRVLVSLKGLGPMEALLAGGIVVVSSLAIKGMLAITRTISRRIHGAASDVTVPKLSGFSLLSPKKVEVEYADGTKFNFSSEFLRVHSPAADGKVRSIAGQKVISGRRYVGIMSAEPVGNYGVRLVFDDLHKTGIYPWDYFYELGSNKFGLMRNYINTLKKHNLSREPPPKRR